MLGIERYNQYGMVSFISYLTIDNLDELFFISNNFRFEYPWASLDAHLTISSSPPFIVVQVDSTSALEANSLNAIAADNWTGQCSERGLFDVAVPDTLPTPTVAFRGRIRLETLGSMEYGWNVDGNAGWIGLNATSLIAKLEGWELLGFIKVYWFRFWIIGFGAIFTNNLAATSFVVSVELTSAFLFVFVEFVLFRVCCSKILVVDEEVVVMFDGKTRKIRGWFVSEFTILLDINNGW